jgi:hypothetical protein
MAITEQTVVDKIEVMENGVVQVRQANRIIKDGVQIAQSFHRYALFPEQDISVQPANVQAICNATWTPEVISAYQAQQPNTLGN